MIPPQIIIMAGPNGAGKSTSASVLVPPDFEFVNADEIAKGLTDIPPEQRDIHAGRLMLKTLDQLEEHRKSFAVETTLASRSLSNRISRLHESGYESLLLFLWLPSADEAVARVAARVRIGGHNIPEAVVQRRFKAGLSNLFEGYMRTVKEWRLYDSSIMGGPHLVAQGDSSGELAISDHKTWARVLATKDGNK